MYVEYPATGERELYDTANDPYQMNSLHNEPDRAIEMDAPSARPGALRNASGEDFRAAQTA